MTPEQIFPHAIDISYVEPEEGYAIVTLSYDNDLYGVAVVAVSSSSVAFENDRNPYVLLTLVTSRQLADDIHAFYRTSIEHIYKQLHAIEPLRFYETPISKDFEIMDDIDVMVSQKLKQWRTQQN